MQDFGCLDDPDRIPHHEKPAGDVMTRRLIEIESLADFDAHISETRRLNGWFVQSVDLTERADVLAEVDPRGAVFLGCVFTPTVEGYLRRSGALLFPRLPDLPFDRTAHSRTTPSSFMALATTHPAWTRWCTPGPMVNPSGRWRPS